MSTLLVLLLGIFLYMDRFLFRGELARLFVQGWQQIVHFQPRKAVPPAASCPAVPVSSEELVLRKEYTEGMERQAGEQSLKYEPSGDENITFTSRTEASAQPEVLEWRDPTYFSDPPSTKLSASHADTHSQSPRWEDDDFAGGIHSSNMLEAEISLQTEQIQREVAASLENWKIDEYRVEMEMSREEASDVDAFDMDAYL